MTVGVRSGREIGGGGTPEGRAFGRTKRILLSDESVQCDGDSEPNKQTRYLSDCLPVPSTPVPDLFRLTGSKEEEERTKWTTRLVEDGERVPGHTRGVPGFSRQNRKVGSILDRYGPVVDRRPSLVQCRTNTLHLQNVVCPRKEK